MASGTIKKALSFEEFQVTTGGSQYLGYYYADYQIHGNKDNVISLVHISSTDNRPTFFNFAENWVRVYATYSNTTVKARIVYKA